MNKIQDKIDRNIVLLIIVIILMILASSLDAKTLDKSYKIQMENYIKNMDYRDRLKIIKIYNLTEKRFKFSLSAISVIESKIGNEIINFNKNGSLDCGILQNNTLTISKVRRVKHNEANKKFICSKLINDFNYSIKSSERVLSYFFKYHKGNWMKTWGSYNSGHKSNLLYAEKIKLTIKLIKKYIINNENSDFLKAKYFVKKVRNLEKKELENYLISIYGLVNLDKKLDTTTLR